MARPNLVQVASLSSQEAFRWDVNFIGATSLVANQEGLNIRATSTDVPKVVMEPVEVNIRGIRYFEPTISNETGDITLKFRETEDQYIRRLVTALQAAYSLPGVGSQVPKVMTQLAIQLRQLNRQDVGIWQYTMANCLLKEPDYGELGSDTGNQEISLSFKYSGVIATPL